MYLHFNAKFHLIIFKLKALTLISTIMIIKNLKIFFLFFKHLNQRVKNKLLKFIIFNLIVARR